MTLAIIEISTLIVTIIIAIVLYKILENGKQLAMNAVLGIIVLLGAKYFIGLKIAITLLTVIICAFGGVFGALLIIVLNFFGIAFL